MNTLQIIQTKQEQTMEDRIDEYLQALDSVELYRTRVVKPFEAHAKTIGGTVYGGEVNIQYVYTERPQKPNARQTLERLASHLTAAITNQGAGKQMYGVRRFGETVAIDAAYLSEQLDAWQAPTGMTPSVSITYKTTKESAENARELARTHYGRLATVANNQPTFERFFTQDDVALYVAACEQITVLKKEKIKPVVDALKKNAQPHNTKTTFDNQDFGEFSAQVMTVPRFEPDYTGVLKGVSATINVAAETHGDGPGIYYNTNLAEPRMYIAIDALQKGITGGLSVLYRKQKQEVSILRKPPRAMILALD